MISADIVTLQPDLPDEIWLEVFERLPADDRRSIRLTCRRFYDICACVRLEALEEMVFYGDMNNVVALGQLYGPRRKVWNLKFLGTPLRANSGILSFFRSQGAKVHSLTFDLFSTVTPELLGFIILNCVNLRSFAIIRGSTRSYYEPSLKIETVFDDFQALVDDGIIRQHVSSFTLDMDPYKVHRCLKNEKFLLIFILFPNIKQLDFRCRVSFNGDRISEPSAQRFPSHLTGFSSRPLSFSHIYDQLFKMRHLLEKLTLQLVYHHLLNAYGSGLTDEIRSRLFRYFFKIPQIEMENLKELSINWPGIWSTSVINPFVHIRHLTEFHCEIFKGMDKKITGSDLIQLLLHTVTQLRTLTVSVEYGLVVCLTNDCFQALVRSRLQTLYFFGEKATFNIEHLSSECIEPNRTLKQLKFEDNHLDESSYILQFISYFQCLESLVVKKLDENILSNIFRYQTKLRRLISKWSSSMNLSALQQWLTNDELPRQLDHLTSLCLIENESLDLSELFLTELNFPKLESLTIIIRDANRKTNYNTDAFWQIIQKFSELVYLEVRWRIAVSPQQLLDLCTVLSKLRYLLYFCPDIKPLRMQDYHQLLEEHPSLRIVIHKYCTYYSVKYSKDMVSNNVDYALPCYLDQPKSVYEGIPHKYPPYYYSASLCELT